MLFFSIKLGIVRDVALLLGCRFQVLDVAVSQAAASSLQGFQDQPQPPQPQPERSSRGIPCSFELPTAAWVVFVHWQASGMSEGPPLAATPEAGCPVC